MPETGYGIKTVMKALLRGVSISRDLDNAIGSDDFFETINIIPGVSADETAEKLSKPKKEIDAPVTGELL